MQLRIVLIDSLSFFKCSNGEHILVELVHGDAIVEEGLPATSVILLEMLLADNG